MSEPVVLRKAETIRRAVERAREEYRAASDFRTDYTRQDAALLNLLRSCEAAIDLAQHLLAERRAAPQDKAADAFEELYRRELIAEDLQAGLRAMVGFRNIAVHDYRKLNLDVVEAIIRGGTDDLLRFAALALKLERDDRTGGRRPPCTGRSASLAAVRAFI